MIRILLLALWAGLVSLSSSDAIIYWKANRAANVSADKPRELEQKKTRTINVPIIGHGQVQGYVVAQFIYVADSSMLKSSAFPPDAVIVEEAFRMLYAEEKVDFAKIQKADLRRLTEDLKTRVAQRLKSDLVKDILVQEFNYVSKDEIRK
jgi:hypothetical protein